MIEIKNLTKKFDRFTAINNISIQFEQGRSYALIGPNGCGKTTLIKSILGLNVTEPQTIFVDGKDISEDYHYRENIGYMPQIGRYPENMTVAQTIDFIENSRSQSSQKDKDLYEAFSVASLSGKKMGTLSGGTTQKISAVLAFMFNPKIVILDEPTAGLDPLASEILKKKIIEEKDKGKLIIITSHLLSELDDIITDVVFMNEGKVLVQQPVATLLQETGTVKISDSIVQILKQIKTGSLATNADE